MERNSKKIIKRLKKEGWTLKNIKGSHHTFSHPKKDAIVTVSHPVKDLPIGQVMDIYRKAGWR
jgi:predicted RNA binding protein YcfA (HicA-like mRNA interferase family)